jgi:primosomal protein N'
MTLSQNDFADVPLVSFGPFEAPVYRVENCYRMRMVVKCRLNKRSRALFSTLLTRFAPSPKGNAKPILSVDFNPSSL